MHDDACFWVTQHDDRWITFWLHPMLVLDTPQLHTPPPFRPFHGQMIGVLLIHRNDHARTQYNAIQCNAYNYNKHL